MYNKCKLILDWCHKNKYFQGLDVTLLIASKEIKI